MTNIIYDSALTDAEWAIIDSQSVKTTKRGGARGYDAGKKVVGRKRHIVVDTLGMIHSLIVHPANIQDRDGATMLFDRMEDALTRRQKVFADGGYRGKLVKLVEEKKNWLLEIVKRNH